MNGGSSAPAASPSSSWRTQPSSDSRETTYPLRCGTHRPSPPIRQSCLMTRRKSRGGASTAPGSTCLIRLSSSASVTGDDLGADVMALNRKGFEADNGFLLSFSAPLPTRQGRRKLLDRLLALRYD